MTILWITLLKLKVNKGLLSEAQHKKLLKGETIEKKVSKPKLPSTPSQQDISDVNIKKSNTVSKVK